MLYVTTRNNRDAYTAYRALRERRGPDGGFYLPMRMPSSPIPDMKEKNFGQTVAEVIDLLFNAELSGWDVEFSIGRAPVRLTAMSHRIVIAQAWHNPEWCFDKTVRELFGRIHPAVDPDDTPGDWTEIAIRIAVLFGIFGELSREGSLDQPVDIAVPSEDFAGVMSAWYAREWGLPVGRIVCCCNENASVWELLHHGQLRTDAVCVPTSTPLCDRVLPRGLERLVFACGGYGETERFLECVRTGRTYRPSEMSLSRMREGLFVSVVSEKRLESTIPNVFRTNSCVLGPYSALAYAGLLDYRARTGESRTALVLSERSPLLDGKAVCSMMGISPRQLEQCMNQLPR